MISHVEYENDIAAIAYEISRAYRPATAADARQEVFAEFYTEAFQNNLSVALEAGNDAPYVRAMARLVAIRCCKTERAAAYGYDPDDNSAYPRGQVIELLDGFFQWKHDGTITTDEAPTGRNSTPANERGVRQAMMCDLSGAMDRLRKQDRTQATLLRFVHQPQPNDEGVLPTPAESFALWGTMTGTKPDSARKAYDRAVARLARLMSGELHERMDGRDFVGSRQVLTNAQAQQKVRDL